MMAEHDENHGERSDPVLVRPYITTEPATGDITGPVTRPDDGTAWPDPAGDSTREQPAAQETPAPVPATSTSRSKSSLLRRQRLVVLAGIAALAVGVGTLVAVGTLDDDGDTALPAPQGTAAPTPGGDGVLGEAPSQTSPSVRVTGSSAAPSRQPSTPARPGTATSGPAAGNPANPQPAKPGTTSPGTPAPTLSPPPGTAIVGPITSGSTDRCLAYGGFLGFDGPVQVSGCSGIAYQEFTLDPDGTMTVGGKCAHVNDDGDVRTTGCDDQGDEAQWRRGPGNTLVNLSTGGCLTDPGTSGATTRVEPCTGSSDQTWKLG
jgi:hypothetical protein